MKDQLLFGNSLQVLNDRIVMSNGFFSEQFSLVGKGSTLDLWCSPEKSPGAESNHNDSLQLALPGSSGRKSTFFFSLTETRGLFTEAGASGQMDVRTATCRYLYRAVNGRPVSEVSQVRYPSGERGLYQVDPNQLHQRLKFVYLVNQETGERTCLIDSQPVSEVEFFRQAIMEAPLLLSFAVDNQPYPALHRLAVELLAVGTPVHRLFGEQFGQPLEDAPPLRFMPEMALVNSDRVVAWLDSLLSHLDPGSAGSDLIEALRFLNKLYLAASKQEAFSLSDIQPPACCEKFPLLKKRPARTALSELERQAAFETLCRVYWPWVLTRLWLIRETHLAAAQINHPLSEGIGHFFEEARQIKIAALEKALSEEVPAEEAAARQAILTSWVGQLRRPIVDFLQQYAGTQLVPQHKKSAESLFNEEREKLEKQRAEDTRVRLAREEQQRQERARVAQLAQVARKQLKTLVAESESWIEAYTLLKSEPCEMLAQDIERLKAAKLEAEREAKKQENRRKKDLKKAAKIGTLAAASSSDLGGTPISGVLPQEIKPDALQLVTGPNSPLRTQSHDPQVEACQLGSSPLEVLTRESGHLDLPKKVHAPYSSSRIPEEAPPHLAPLFRTNARGRCVAVLRRKACYSGNQLTAFLNQSTDIPQNLRAELGLTAALPVSILLTLYNTLIKEDFILRADFREDTSIMPNSAESELQKRLARLPAGAPNYAELKAKMKELMRREDMDDLFARFLNHQQGHSLAF